MFYLQDVYMFKIERNCLFLLNKVYINKTDR